jgi:hypothetical protein
MPSAGRHLATLGTVIVVVVASLTILIARASLGTAPPLDFTPTAFVYAPVLFRDYAPSTPTPTITPTPTTTPTNTPTTVPTHARLHLCCFDLLDEACSGCWGFYTLGSGEEFVWQSGGLPMDIAGTSYEFGIAASSGGNTTFEVELFLLQEESILLASTSFTANSSQAERYVRVVQGIDPAVTIDEDRLMMRISNVSGAAGQIYFGEPGSAEAGGSYIEFPQSR